MWSLWTVVKETRTRPSDLIGINDRWVALQFDQAVIWFGSFIEGKLMETHNIGTKKEPKIEPKYKLSDLLADQPNDKPTIEQYIEALSGFGTVVKR